MSAEYRRVAYHANAIDVGLQEMSDAYWEVHTFIYDGPKARYIVLYERKPD